MSVIPATLSVASVIAAFGAAVLWFLSAHGQVPLLPPGMRLGGPNENEPIIAYIRHGAALNQWAAFLTAVALIRSAAERVLGWFK